MKVAIVHDYLTQYGGAEKVLEVMHDLFPQAPIYTSVYAPSALPPQFKKWKIRQSFMQRLPLLRQRHQLGLPFYPAAFERFDFSEYDLVLSSSSAWAKGVVTGPDTLHICYCHAPMRFAWTYNDYLRGENIGSVGRFLLPFLLSYIRVWDEMSAQRVDAYIANSRSVARRIAKYYRRQATVINPPIESHHFTPSDGYDDYFLVVSRLVPYKRLDIVVETFNKLGLPLKIVGQGRQREELQQQARPNIEFLGSVPQDELARLFRRCKAFIWTEEADFGIAPVEVQASGRPVIAYAAGGVLETVIPGVTGVFFDEQTTESLTEAVLQFNPEHFNAKEIRKHADKYDVSVFKRRMTEFIADRMAEHREAAANRQPHRSNGVVTGTEAELPLITGEPNPLHIRS